MKGNNEDELGKDQMVKAATGWGGVGTQIGRWLARQRKGSSLRHREARKKIK